MRRRTIPASQRRADRGDLRTADGRMKHELAKTPAAGEESEDGDDPDDDADERRENGRTSLGDTLGRLDLSAEHRQEQSTEEGSQPQNSWNSESGHDDDLNGDQDEPEHDQGEILPPARPARE